VLSDRFPTSLLSVVCLPPDLFNKPNSMPENVVSLSPRGSLSGVELEPGCLRYHTRYPEQTHIVFLYLPGNVFKADLDGRAV
jgi:hypothetical protein